MSKRSYGQFCGVARALDVVGGRWSLLIVRELLVGPARYSELVSGLPGIATNLLTDRLRALEEAGVVDRQLDPDTKAVVYVLTPWGNDLRGAVNALVRWSTPLMIPGPDGDIFQPHWLAVALEALLRGKRADVSTTVGVEVDSRIVTVCVDQTGPHVRLDGVQHMGTVLRAEPLVVLGLASGMLTVDDVVAAGGVVRGDKDQLAAVFGPADGLVEPALGPTG